MDDKRSPEEIFRSLTDQMHQRYNGTLTDKEAEEAARRLVQFYRLLSEIKPPVDKAVPSDSAQDKILL